MVKVACKISTVVDRTKAAVAPVVKNFYCYRQWVLWEFWEFWELWENGKTRRGKRGGTRSGGRRLLTSPSGARASWAGPAPAGGGEKAGGIWEFWEFWELWENGKKYCI